VSTSAHAPLPQVAGAALRAVRPRQWVKNVLVLAAPLTAGQGRPGRIEIAFLVAQAVTSTLNFLGMRNLVFVSGRRPTDG